MYRQFTADDYRKHLGLATDYSIEGFIVFGSFKRYPYEMLKDSLLRLGRKAEFSNIEHEFLNPILEFKIDGEVYWFAIAYGGALLSEYLHLACLFGSKKNILLGSCGGLKKGASSREILIPTWSHAQESSAKAYQPEAGHKYESDAGLSERLAGKLEQEYKVHRGPTVTYQAMMAETWEDVLSWAEQGYFGVEMEAATVFATSRHFKVPAAAILRIGDNLIEKETVLDINYEKEKDLRRKASEDTFDVALEEIISKQ
ncbi:MAG TPA: hypothetical protein VJG48_01245 [Candidatus Paceibacterota bacterium]